RGLHPRPAPGGRAGGGTRRRGPHPAVRVRPLDHRADREDPPRPRRRGRVMTGWAATENALAVRLDAMGDVLMTGPALRALAEGRPGRRVTLLTSPAGAAAAALLPGVDRVIVYDAPWMKAAVPRTSSKPDL